MNEEFKELYIEGCTYKTKLTRKFGLRKIKPEVEDPKIVRAFIPGLIKSVYVKEGDGVKRGDKLLVLEAMKMENQILSGTKGVVKKVHTQPGKVVVKGELLLEIE